MTPGGSPDDYAAHPVATRARRVMPRGNTRTTLYVPPTPPYAVRGEGCWVEDQLGHRVIDCNNNYTALIHGHAHPATLAATLEQAVLGTSFGLPTTSEVDFAQTLAGRTSLPQWRFSNSGSEAVMTAVRAARAHTGRSLLVRFEGSYHGTYDAVVSATSAGVPEEVSGQTIALPQQDRAAFDDVMAEHGSRVAAVLVDLMPNRAGLVPADAEFVEHLRRSTREHDALLVVDEVISFRLAEGGLHAAYGVEPDLLTLGKMIGGGFPVGAVGGTAEVMSTFDPERPGAVAWGGTFSANPMSMEAGLAALRAFTKPVIDELNAAGDRLRDDLLAAGVDVSGRGSLLRIREGFDASTLWWDLYADGVLAGSNGLLALSTAMTPTDLTRVRDVVVGVVERNRSAAAR